MLLYGCDRTADEKLEQWLETAFLPGIAVPFSFYYDGVNSREFLDSWTWLHMDGNTDDGSKLRIVSIQAPDGMKVIIEIKKFADFPVVEWLLCFENESKQDSKMIENVCAMDLCIEAPPHKSMGTMQFGAHDNIFYYAGGSDCKIDDFIPLQEILHALTNKKVMHFGSMNGRPTSGSHGSMPYFCMQTRDCGVIMAIGWSGQWYMDLYPKRDSYRFEGGMPNIHTLLHPGESIRSPRILMMPWVGDRIDGHNVFRRFMVKHHTPKVDGKPAMPPIAMDAWGSRQSEHMKHLKAIHETGLKLDAYWIDAGWYMTLSSNSDIPTNNDWDHVSCWDHDAIRYPDGLKPVSDKAHALGMRFLLWFDPEKATYGSPITLEHPEYFLGERLEGRPLLVNLGFPEARQWITDTLSRKIEEYGIDILRVDYNIDPLDKWDGNDELNRRGITQIRCVEGFYKFWDTLLERHPGLVIDNCASGGRRLDFEAVSRSITLFRSDYLCYADNDPIGVQLQTGGLAFWLPVSAIAFGNSWLPEFKNPSRDIIDQYRFRSTLSQGMSIGHAFIESAATRPYIRSKIKLMLSELRRVRDLYYGDYYPLTAISMQRTDWFAYEMHRPDLGRGIVVSIRRDECPFTHAVYHLRGLEGDANYEIEDADTGNTTVCKGSSLMSEGLSVDISTVRTAKLTYFSRLF